MKAVVILFLAAFALPSFAGSVREDIQRLSREIREIAPHSDASEEDLRQALDKLVEARDLLGESNGGGRPGNKSCVDFAYNAYKVTYGEGATAANFAVEGAKKLKRGAASCVRDLYPRYAATYGQGATSINFAIDKCK